LGRVYLMQRTRWLEDGGEGEKSEGEKRVRKREEREEGRIGMRGLACLLEAGATGGREGEGKTQEGGIKPPLRLDDFITDGEEDQRPYVWMILLRMA
jgi:hypothetical protein